MRTGLRPEHVAVLVVAAALSAALCSVAVVGGVTLLNRRSAGRATALAPATQAALSTAGSGETTPPGAAPPTARPSDPEHPAGPAQPSDPALDPWPTLVASPQAPPGAPPVEVEARLGGMSLEEKIGQMIMAGIPGPVVGFQAAHLIDDLHIGSVVYFAGNTRSAEQTQALSAALQAAAQGGSPGVGLFIAVDHEGGSVFRFRQGLTHFPSMMSLGAAGSVDLAYQAGAANAAELAAVGVNLDLGPVLDVNSQALNPVIGLRSLGDDAANVSLLGAAYLRGVQDGGVTAAAKHYPGHGDTLSDSHDQLPVLSADVETLMGGELVPFMTAIANRVGMVMVGHLAFPAIDPSGRPASLSQVMVTDLLRGRLGYQGVVVTDSMAMGAIAKQYRIDEAAELAVQAGCDILAYPDGGAAETAHAALVQAVQSGRIGEAQIDAAVRRILILKAQAGLMDAGAAAEPPAGPPAIDYAGHAALVKTIAAQAVSVVGRASAPLINTPAILLITPDTISSGAAVGDGLSSLGERLQASGVQVDEWIYSPAAPQVIAALQPDLLAAAQEAPLVIFMTWDARLEQARGFPGQMNLLNALLAGGRPLILAAGSSPYDLGLLPPDGVGVAIYGGLDEQVEALAAALMAEQLPPGRTPVRLP